MKSRKHFIQIPAFVQKTKFKYPFEKKANANSVLKSHKINVNECIRLTKEINELEKKYKKSISLGWDISDVISKELEAKKLEVEKLIKNTELEKFQVKSIRNK